VKTVFVVARITSCFEQFLGDGRGSRLWKRLALLAVAWLFPALALAAEEVVSVTVREGVQESYLLVTVPGSKPHIIVMSFVGGPGAIDLPSRAAKGTLRFGPGANFLVRVRDSLADNDIADAIVDAPSDHLPGGMDDNFRLSAQHADDIAAIARDLAKRYPDAKLYAFGTSRGTTSAASFGARHPELLAGVILSSTVTVSDRSGWNLSRFDFDSIKVPLLLVHHRDDACRSSPYGGAQRLAAKYPLVTVEGGDPPRSDACEAQSPHGYLGREKGTTDAIKQWLRTGSVVATVQQ
jgi:pimeloyl-ACP methyl ester carboxylesterase